MIKQKILEDLRKVVKEIGLETTDIVCTILKNPQFGDYSTNLALQLAKLKEDNGKQSPIQIANKILEKFGKPDYLEKAEVAGNGFINFFVKEKELVKNADGLDILKKSERPQKVLVEYGGVNPLKEIHIGHLRNFILGESLSRIFDALGNTVFRANYQGDIGLHIAKAIWGIKKAGLPTIELSHEQKAEFLGKAYADGTTAYDGDEQVKGEIDKINISL